MKEATKPLYNHHTYNINKVEVKTTEGELKELLLNQFEEIKKDVTSKKQPLTRYVDIPLSILFIIIGIALFFSDRTNLPIFIAIIIIITIIDVVTNIKIKKNNVETIKKRSRDEDVLNNTGVYKLFDILTHESDEIDYIELEDLGNRYKLCSELTHRLRAPL